MNEVTEFVLTIVKPTGNVEIVFKSVDALRGFALGFEQNAPAPRRRKASAAKAKPTKQPS